MLDEFADGPADTVPFTFLRHASAGSKHDWTGDDLDRPLDAGGAADATRVARLLSCFGSRRVISSAAERCVATVRPYAALTGVPLAIEPAFTAGRGREPGCGSRCVRPGGRHHRGGRAHCDLRAPGEPAVAGRCRMRGARRAGAGR